MTQGIEAELRLGGDCGYRVLQRKCLQSRHKSRIEIHLVPRGGKVGTATTSLCSDVSIMEHGMELPIFPREHKEKVEYCELCVSLAEARREKGLPTTCS